MPLVRRINSITLAQSPSIESVNIPPNPSLNQKWDKIDNAGAPSSRWYWNGTYWIEREDRILNFLGWVDHPYSVPKISDSSGIWIKSFRSTTTGGEFNSDTKYIRYRLGDMNTANSFSVIVLAVNESRIPTGRGEYVSDVNVIYPIVPSGLNITHVNVGGSSENSSYSGHSIIYRCVR
ncbi:hypothetical protein [Anabaena lutea]|uniref:Uncharacterized protein n=1 Tax=Anabaena lutea FACHB-196 TaxID=2692881 RepID=A0ABR8FLM0_9NOST|nr:hypothetical protein [Anabaena lutea]MBD2571063.1 hypothetical protein [Anabaena lutea FACHB-196]